jgi:hypothetical protein
MSYTYYENWRRESLRVLKEAQKSKTSLELLMQKSNVKEKDLVTKLEEVSRLISDAEGLHKRYKYPDALKLSRQALSTLKELHYLALASGE